jgi:hypothetical protein
LQFLIDRSPVKARQIVPPVPNQSDLLDITPKSIEEECLLNALKASLAREQYQRRRILELQAASVLNEAFFQQVQERLNQKEAKKGEKGTKGRLMGDGMPVLLTSDEFYEKVVEFEAETRRKEQEKLERAEARKELSGQLAEWKKQEDERKEANQRQRDTYKAAVQNWEEARARWQERKSTGKVTGAFKQKKPLQGPLRKPIPKPKKSDFIVEDDEDSYEADSEDEEDE